LSKERDEKIEVYLEEGYDDLLI